MHNYVWEDDVIPHKFKRLPDMFKISRIEDNGKTELDIDVMDVKSHFFGYLINTSRLYWRKETESRFDGDLASAKAYLSSHPFEIAGEGLTSYDIREQQWTTK